MKNSNTHKQKPRKKEVARGCGKIKGKRRKITTHWS